MNNNLNGVAYEDLGMIENFNILKHTITAEELLFFKTTQEKLYQLKSKHTFDLFEEYFARADHDKDTGIRLLKIQLEQCLREVSRMTAVVRLYENFIADLVRQENAAARQDQVPKSDKLHLSIVK